MTANNQQRRFLLYALLISVAVSFTVFYVMGKQDKKIAVVDAIRLFNEYNMKKDLEKQVEGKLEFLGKQLDSLDKLMQEQAYLKNKEGDEQLFNNYGIARQRLDKEYSESNRLINEMVWKRLNPLVDEYGKKHGLHLIIGANGMGSVLYNDSYYDLTDELIKHVNKNYENE